MTAGIPEQGSAWGSLASTVLVAVPHSLAYGSPVKKGVKGAMTLHTVSSTSNRAASAMAVSSGPLRPCGGGDIRTNGVQV